MLEGLRLVWDKGFRKIELECDNSILVRDYPCRGAANCTMMELRLVYDMIIRAWDIRIQHISRDQNTVADCLTKVVSPILSRLILLDEPPLSVREYLLVDSNLSSLY